MINRDEKLMESEIKKLVPVLGKESANRLNRAYLLGDEKTKKRIFEVIDIVKAAVFSKKELRDSILMEPPPRNVASKGELNIGHALYGRKRLYPIMLEKDALLTHIGVFGSSGYGKTNIAFGAIKQLSDNGVPVLIFDFSKRNYKDLLSTELRDRIEIFTIGRNVSPFRFNPLIPPEGVLLSQWMKEFSSIFDHAYWLLGGGRHVIMKALDGVYDDNDKPVMKDIKAWLSEYASGKMPARERNWVATAERPLESLCFKELGEVFDCTEGIKPSEFFKPGKITILELDSLDTNDKTFLIEITLQWIRDWLMVSGKKEELVGTVILEEAHHVLNREKSKKLGTETVIDLIFREVRELGLGVIYIDQHPSMVSYPALGNTSTHIYMNLGLDTKHGSDILDASNMLGLDYEEQGGYIRKLPIGHGFMLCRNSEFPNSFLVEFDKFDLEKGCVDDAEIKDFMKDKVTIENPVRETPVSRAADEYLKEKEESAKANERHDEWKERQEKPKDGDGKNREGRNIPMNEIQEMSENDWDMIKAIGDGSGTFSSQIYKTLKISGTTFNKRVEKLIDLGLVEMKKGKIKKNRMNYYYLTGTGIDVFETRYGERESAVDVNVDNILEMFRMAGWKFEKNGNRIELNIGNRKANIVVANELNREKITYDIARNRYFLCASEQIKNMVIQESARRAREGKALTLFISDIKDFEDKGEFERIEFD